MPFYDNLEENQKRSLAKSPVWPMSSLPYQQKRSMGGAGYARMPIEFKRPVLDFDAERRRSGNLSSEVRQNGYSKVLKGLASVGKPLWEPEFDPLFWCLRMGNANWKAPLPLRALQPEEKLPELNALQAGTSASASQYRAMAAWACRCYAPERNLSKVLVQICCERLGYQLVGYSTACSFSHNETVSWLKWLGIAHKGTFPLPSTPSKILSSDKLGWHNLGLGPDDAYTLLGYVQEYGYLDNAGRRALKELTDTGEFGPGTQFGLPLPEGGLPTQKEAGFR